MSDYFDAIHFKKTKSGSVFAVKLGSAKKREDGGFNLYLDAIPASVNGQYEIQIVPPRDKVGKPAGKPVELDDEIPF